LTKHSHKWAVVRVEEAVKAASVDLEDPVVKVVLADLEARAGDGVAADKPDLAGSEVEVKVAQEGRVDLVDLVDKVDLTHKMTPRSRKS
jgi:hypothetical protein